ncbi:phage tail protein, partial [Streptococcus uberis]
IKDHKGPISYDKVLLIDAGNAIMDGLHNGLLDNFNHSVKPLVSGMADQLRDAFGIPTLSADVGIAQPNMSAVTASTYQLMSNFGQSSFEQASLSDVVNEIRQLRNRQQVIEAHLDSNLVGRLIANPVGSTLKK